VSNDKITPDVFAQAVLSPRFVALSQLGISLGDLVNFDSKLLREPRLLVPVDVCALVVRAGDDPMVRLPFRAEEDVAPDPTDAGTTRDPGVHLLWSIPAALGRGKLVDDPAAPGDHSRRLLELRTLPDRWVVLRIVVPVGASDAVVTGWVLEADNATVTPLSDWPAVRTNMQTVGTAIPAAQLNVHIGGANWTTSYDAALGRLSLHDPLVDLDTIAPDGVVGDAISYVVGGWWSVAKNDPLDDVSLLTGYQRRLADLGWFDPDHPPSESETDARSQRSVRVAEAFSLPVQQRYTAPASASRADVYESAISRFAGEANEVAALPSTPTRSTLLHGRIHGVPLRTKPVPQLDDRPPPAKVGVAVGSAGPSVAAVLASGAMTSAVGADQQQASERLLTAFSAGLLARIEEPDVWPEIDQIQHAHGFSSQSGGVEAVDRFVDTVAPGNDPGSGHRPNRRVKIQNEMIALDQNVLWSSKKYPTAFMAVAHSKAAASAKVRMQSSAPDAATAVAKAKAGATTRSVERPAPPFTAPVAPALAVVGAGRRLLASEREEANGQLGVRLSDHAERGLAGILAADELLHTIGSGAVPDEMLALARESLAADPNLVEWRQGRLHHDDQFAHVVGVRMRAEATINYAYYSGDNQMLSKMTGATVDSHATRQLAVEGLLRHSLVEGVMAHPEGVTMWGQPWRPQFCDWTVDLDLVDLAQLLAHDDTAWELAEFDLQRTASFDTAERVTITGRSPLITTMGKALLAAVDKWLDDEHQRDQVGHGLASPQLEAAMSGLRSHLAELDVLSVTLDGIRQQLLGIRYDRGVVRNAGDAGSDGVAKAVAIALPRLVAAGRLRVRQARIVDSFGRTVALPVDDAVVVIHDNDTVGLPATTNASLQLRPRLMAPARVHLRLVDSTSIDPAPQSALVDQADLTLQVNPVAGFLLPDHIDEALEMFATDGTPLGQVSHDGFSDAVFWEGAPGRLDIGPAAGPLDDPDITRRRLGWIAAGLVTSDATSRQATPDRPESESPLSALLRAIDTTLWTVDPLGSLGREHIAGLVGRPIAVVNARLTLDVQQDLDDLVFANGATREEREQAYAELAAVSFEVRLGSAARSDDGLLGYFVDDDYLHLHVIDRAITKMARDSGRSRGLLGVTGKADPMQIEHSYVVPDGTVLIRSGQTVRLTLLMHPGGKVHVSSGISPRTSVALSRDWVQPGLSVIAPSVRCGPLLIDADKVRLPKVSSFPADQLFTRRDTPGSWRDDPILAATQSAYLPDQPSTAQEGWIRIAPAPPAEAQP
jgi:hypothetical protein